MVGYGWCILRSSRESYHDSSIDQIDEIDETVETADRNLWSSFRNWIVNNKSISLTCYFHEQHNNDEGVLLFSVSSNHRSSNVWEMLAWIAENGPGSYGLFYVHDEEDTAGKTSSGRGEADYSNVFRVHRILNGKLDELDDSLLSPIFPNINPSELA